MTTKSEVRCETPRCVQDIAKYGENYHMVYDREDHQRCEYCGGKRADGKWEHKCQMCGKDVAPGTLVGLFVPHRCTECDAKVVAKDRADGRFCRRCNEVLSYCCC